MTSGELYLSFYSSINAMRFVGKITELITGVGTAARGAGKVKNAIGLVDDTLGIDTMGTISGVIENGIGRTLFRGIGPRRTQGKSLAAKATNTADTINAVVGATSALVNATQRTAEPTQAVRQTFDDQTEQSLNEQIESLKKLKQLVDMGIISQEEFEAKKKSILGL